MLWRRAFNTHRLDIGSSMNVIRNGAEKQAQNDGRYAESQ